MTRKEIARDLDRAAARAETVGGEPATGKQCWYIAGLLESLNEAASDWGYGAAHTGGVLTKARASALIDQMLAARALRASV